MKIIHILLTTLLAISAASCKQTEKDTQNDDLNRISLLMRTCKPKEKEAKNEVIENIMSRRSIRSYKAETVDRKTLNKIMECGINAPNGKNKQSWEVRIIDNPQLLNQISDVIGQTHPDNDFAKSCFRGAPVMVFIARDPSYDFSAYDCGLLAQNIMLSAWSLGVGSVCLGSPVRFLTDNEACKALVEKLGFSKGYEFCLCIGLGYADEAPDAKPRDMGKVKFIESL